MKRKLIIASHHQMAAGLTDTLNFISNNAADVTSLSAYMDNQPVDQQVQKIMSELPGDVEVVILTDMLAGSVNQQFFNYRKRPHTHIISGMNLPLALALALEPQDQELTSERISTIVNEAKDAIVDVMNMQAEVDDDDE